MNSNVSLLLLSLFLSSALFAATSATVVGGRKVAGGGWTPIKDLNDPHVQEVAHFAVSEHNARSTAAVKAKLVKILRGETQPVDGSNYRLVLDTVAGTASQKYEAVVYEKSWHREHLQILVSFVPINS